jgi:hypothetical protein
MCVIIEHRGRSVETNTPIAANMRHHRAPPPVGRDEHRSPLHTCVIIEHRGRLVETSAGQRLCGIIRD